MKIIQLKEMIREIISEKLQFESQASDDAKRQGLEYMSFGRWGKDGKITHTTQGDKLVPVKNADGQVDRKLAFPPRVHKSPEAQRDRNKPQDTLASDPSTPGDKGDQHEKLSQKVRNKFYDASFDDLGGVNIDVPFDEFEKRTGITRKAADWYTKNHGDDWEYDFIYDPEKDSVYIPDPWDV